MTAVIQGATGLFTTGGEGRRQHGATASRTRNVEYRGGSDAAVVARIGVNFVGRALPGQFDNGDAVGRDFFIHLKLRTGQRYSPGRTL